MTDDPTNAAGDLGLPGAQAAPAAPPMSYSAAETRKAEILASAELRQKIMDGDVATATEWRQITEALSRPPEIPTGQREDLAEDINAASGYSLSPEVLQQVKDNSPITPEERRATLALWEEKKQDAEWIARLNRGEVRAKRELALIQINLASRVRDQRGYQPSRR